MKLILAATILGASMILSTFIDVYGYFKSSEMMCQDYEESEYRLTQGSRF